jgi:hypothetical protein
LNEHVMTDTDTPNGGDKPKPGFFYPKPTIGMDTPWSYFCNPPLKECGLWWRIKYSDTMRTIECVILAICWVAFSAAIGLAIAMR